MKKILLSVCLFISIISNAQFFAAQQANDDYDAFQLINTAPLTVTINRDAVNILAKGFKVYGLWTLSKAIYPFVGGTASICKWNLKDVRDLDAAFRLVFAGTPTFSTDGVAFISSYYANTFLTPSASLGLDGVTISYYSRTNNTDAGYEFGSQSAPTNRIYLSAKWTDNITYSALNSGTITAGNVISDTRGLFTATRTASNAVNHFRNATSVFSGTTASVGLPTVVMYVGANNSSGTAGGYSSRQCAFALIYNGGMTTTQVANMYGVVQAFQTKLARQL